jgi:hypothetical protein
MLLDQENCEYVETVLRAVARRKSLARNGLGLVGRAAKVVSPLLPYTYVDLKKF